MTNAQFQNRLNSIAKKKATLENLSDFVNLLKVGYDEQLQLIIYCVNHEKAPDLAFHAYIDADIGRFMLCYTNFAAAEKEWRRLPEGDNRQLSVCTASCRDVVDNMLRKPAIAALVFNPDSDNPYIILKEFMQAAIDPSAFPDLR